MTIKKKRNHKTSVGQTKDRKNRFITSPGRLSDSLEALMTCSYESGLKDNHVKDFTLHNQLYLYNSICSQ